MSWKIRWPITKERSPDSDELYRMLYQWLNSDMPIPKMVSMDQFIEYAYMYNPIAFSIISLKASAARGVPWLVYNVKDSKKLRQYRGLQRKDIGLHHALRLKEQALEEVEGTEVNRLLKKPNEKQTFADLVEEWFSFRDITGNAYIYHVPNPVTGGVIQLHSLPSHKVKIIAGTWTNPVQGYSFSALSKEMIPVERVQHWKYFNPNWKGDGSELYGMSPLLPGARIINSDNFGIDNQTSSFKNQGVRGVLTGTKDTEIPFTEEQGKALRDKWKRETARAKSGDGDIAFNRAPLSFVKVGETPIDLGVLDARKYNKEVLCNMFKMHPSLLSSEASTLDNYKEARKGLITNAVLPDMDSLRDKLNTIIDQAYDGKYWIDYDIMAISELQEDLQKLSTTLHTMDWITINEKRRATDYDDYKHPAAEVLYTDMGKIPIGRDVDTGFEDIDENLDKIRKQWTGDR